METVSEAQTNNNIYQLCLNNGFIENFGELKIYDPTEKDKDDLFDEVFEWEQGFCINTDRDKILEYLYERGMKPCETRCVKNLRTDEKITVFIISNRVYVDISSKDGEIKECIGKVLNTKDIAFGLFYSKREIEKKEIEKQIAKLNIPKYINCDFDVATNSLKFYIEGEHLTIPRNDLTKEKILQTIEECKKRYEQKHEKSNSIRNQIQNIFN